MSYKNYYRKLFSKLTFKDEPTETGNEMPSFNLVTALAVFANDCSNEKQRAELFPVAALLLLMRL